MTGSVVDGIDVDSLHARIERGTAFECSSNLSVANSGAKARWLFVTGAKRVIIYSRRVTTNGDEMTYQAFKAPTVSANGDAVAVVKRNGNASIAPTATVFSSPTVSAEGAGIPPVYMPGASGVGNNTVGQFDQEGFVRILEPNTVYLTQVTNNGSKNPANVEWYLMWAEQDVGL